MYYKSEIQGVVRVDPKLFNKKLDSAILKQLRDDFVGRTDENIGKIIKILSIKNIGSGSIVAGDGAAYHKVTFNAIHFKPKLHEIVQGEIRDIAKFGAFVDFGPFEGMVHISQTMDDFVSINKQGTLQGKDSKRVLKKGDLVRARIVAISLKNENEPKIGLTMRQQYLGNIKWLEEERKEVEKAKKKAGK